MLNENKEIVRYWIVKLGKLYYASGLPRLSKEHEDIGGYDFVNKEDIAFPIVIKESAERIANEVGGVVIEKEDTLKNAMKIHEKNEFYTKSADDWYEKQIECFKNSK